MKGKRMINSDKSGCGEAGEVSPNRAGQWREAGFVAVSRGETL